MLVGLQTFSQLPAQTFSETHAFIHSETTSQHPSKPSAKSSRFHSIRQNPVHSFVSITLLLSAELFQSHTGANGFDTIFSVSSTQHTPSWTFCPTWSVFLPLPDDLAYKLMHRCLTTNSSPRGKHQNTCGSGANHPWVLMPDLTRDFPANLHPRQMLQSSPLRLIFLHTLTHHYHHSMGRGMTLLGELSSSQPSSPFPCSFPFS